MFCPYVLFKFLNHFLCNSLQQDIQGVCVKVKTTIVPVMIFIVLGLVACGTTNSTSPSGGGSGGEITLASKGYATTTSSLFDWFFRKAYAASTISTFQFCVTQLKLTGSDGSDLQSNGSSLLTAKLGLINLGSGSATTNWGKVTIPAGAAIKTIKVEVHKDAESCSGATYSASVNGNTVTKDLEFKFSFANAKGLNAGDTVTFAFNNLVKQYESAIAAGKFNDENIGSYMESLTEDTAE